MKWVSLLLFAFTFVNAVNIHTHGQETPGEISPCADATVISFGNGIVFDTRDGGPALPENLSGSIGARVAYHIIQCTGPIYKAWTEDLKQQGIEIMACLIEDWNEDSKRFFENRGYRRFHGISYFTKKNHPDV